MRSSGFRTVVCRGSPPGHIDASGVNCARDFGEVFVDPLEIFGERTNLITGILYAQFWYSSDGNIIYHSGKPSVLINELLKSTLLGGAKNSTGEYLP